MNFSLYCIFTNQVQRHQRRALYTLGLWLFPVLVFAAGITINAPAAYLKASNTESSDKFGIVVAADGDTVVVGANGEDSDAAGIDGNQGNSIVNAQDAGAIYVYVRDGTSWRQQAYIKASNPDRFDQFGVSLDLDGDTLVVGAPFEYSNATGINGDQNNEEAFFAGAVYVFTRSGETWSQQAYIKASNTNGSDYFGWSVAISGDTLVVGAPQESSNATGVNNDQNNNSAANAGAAYVFTRSGNTWSQQAYLKASNTGAGDKFGDRVAIDGNTIVVGAFEEDSDGTGVDGTQNNDNADLAGAAYVFTRSGTTWSQQAYLKASNTDAEDRFGASVALAGDTVVVGAREEDSNARGIDGDATNNDADDAGAVYIFTRSNNTWSQQAYLKASNADGGDRFGNTAAILGDVLVVGAASEASNATDIDGVESNNSAANAGAAYVFTRDAGVWSQYAYLKATNTDSGDFFGGAVALSNNALVVGAIGEQSAATGVDNDLSNNDLSSAGAAYVYDALGDLIFGDGFESTSDL